ncbi:endonuclease NucS domain-containing protein [Ramlibacter sp. PS3R-8]|uniref:endonuclease NucS domain-containing protein n=1 Tax=Ramlibacter sp. PS3R-8 TaxID=3133437 RepID=UPI0030B3594B
MKEWLRANPKWIPAGIHPTDRTSQQIRAALKKQGWTVQSSPDEFRLIPPGADPAMIPPVFAQDEAAEEDSAESSEESAFQFEAQLRDFIAQNLATISLGGQKLKLYVDEEGRDGVEYPTAVGPIDILAVDITGAFHVFELKRARSPDKAIGQLARYMGWLWMQHPTTVVNGVIVAREITQNLRYSIAVFPNVSLFEYEVQFKLHRAEDISP